MAPPADEVAREQVKALGRDLARNERDLGDLASTLDAHIHDDTAEFKALRKLVERSFLQRIPPNIRALITRILTAIALGVIGAAGYDFATPT